MECSHGTCRPQRIWRDERCHQGTRILPAMVGLADIPAAAGAGLSKSCRTRACSSTPTRPAPDQWAAQRIISANPITSHPKRCIGPNFWRMSVGSTRVALLTIALARKDARVLPASLFINWVAQMAQCPDPQAAWWAWWAPGDARVGALRETCCPTSSVPTLKTTQLGIQANPQAAVETNWPLLEDLLRLMSINFKLTLIDITQQRKRGLCHVAATPSSNLV